MTPAPPTGQVTFLLTDIQGSTRMWERASQVMPDVLARHDELMRTSVGDHGGLLIKSKGEGDSTFSVFASPVDAASAALAAQHAIDTEPWPPDCVLTVRMALHTGEAVDREGDYFGRTVNRVARLRAIARGGDVLVSSATAERITAALPDRARLVELGVSQLKDLDQPETVFLLTTATGVIDRAATEPRNLQLPVPARLRAGMHGELVGRQVELDVLTAAWTRATQGHPGVVLVQGEPGIGKSRLVAELGWMVHRSGGLVLAGHCDDGGGAAYQPFADVFRFVTERQAGPVSGPVQLALAHLAPDLVEAGTLASRSADADREALLGAMGVWLKALSREAPVLLVIEDLHWATAPTIDMLRAVLRDLDEDRILIVATSRHSDRSTEPAHVLLDGARQFVVPIEEVDLAGLSTEQTAHLLAVDQETATAVHEFTGGNPLFALAMATTMGDGATADLARTQLPESIHAVLDRQLARLDDASRAFLRAASILGSTFEVDLAAQLAGADFEVVENALDLGERNLVVHEQSAGVVHLYEFSHALVAAALTSQLTAIRRRAMHARAMALVATTPRLAGDRLTRVAHHAAQAGPAVPPHEAIAAFRDAARQARDRLSVEDAIGWLESAGTLVDAIDDPPLAVEVDVELGSARRAAGRPGGRELIQDAAERAHRLGDPILMADALIAGDDDSDYLRVDRRRIALLESCLELLPSDDHGRRARLSVLLARALLFDEATTERRGALADEALASARRLDDPSLIVFVLEHRLWLFGGPAHLAQRSTEIAELQRLLDAGGVPTARRFSIIAAQSQALEQLGRVEEGRASLDQLHQLGDLLPNQQLVLDLLTTGWELLAGRLAAAEECVRAARHAMDTKAVADMRAATARQLLGIRAWQDRTERMLGPIAAGVAHFPLQKAHYAYWLLHAGRLDEAAAVWAEWTDDPIEGLLARGSGGDSLVVEAASVCATFGDAERCRRYYAWLEPFSERLLNPFAPDQPTDHYLGQLAAAIGDRELAVQHMERSRAFAERIGAPLMAARAAIELAELHRPSDLEQAVGLARQAVATGDEYDAAWLVRRGTELLSASDRPARLGVADLRGELRRQ